MGWNEEIKKDLKYCGENVKIGHNVIFTNPGNVHLGNNVRIDPFTLITAGLHTGNYIHICSHNILGGSHNTIYLKDWTTISYHCQLFTSSDDYSGDSGPVNEYWFKNKTNSGDIIFEEHSGIASNVMIFPNIILPEGCRIGANSAVYKQIEFEPWSIYIGNPAKLKSFRNKDKVYELLKDKDNYNIRI